MSIVHHRDRCVCVCVCATAISHIDAHANTLTPSIYLSDSERVCVCLPAYLDRSLCGQTGHPGPGLLQRRCSIHLLGLCTAASPSVNLDIPTAVAQGTAEGIASVT